MSVRRFLLVDDDYDDTELFSEAIGSVDASAFFLNASHGRDALDKLQKQEIQMPDIIFLDINMPVMDGWQFLSKIKQSESLREIPVIMYSTSSKKSDIKTAMSSGALCFFTKPDSFLRLKKILQIVVLHMENGKLDKVCDAISAA
jgi:CheY-like chemotaxis protein